LTAASLSQTVAVFMSGSKQKNARKVLLEKLKFHSGSHQKTNALTLSQEVCLCRTSCSHVKQGSLKKDK